MTRLLAAKEEQAKEVLASEREVAKDMARAMMSAALVHNPVNESMVQLSQHLVEEKAKKKRKDMTIGPFAGDKQDWLDYRGQFENCTRYNQWDEEERFQQLVVHLRADALALYTDHQPTTYEGLVKLLGERYTPEGSEEVYKAKFKGRHLHEKEDLEVYSRELTRLARRAYPHWGQEAIDEQVLDQFRAGLVDPELRRHVTLGKFDTLREAVAAAARYQRFEENARSHLSKPKPARIAAATTSESDPAVDTRAVVKELERPDGFLGRVLAMVTKWPGNVNSPNASPLPYRRPDSRRSLQCWCCRKEGHTYYRCPDNKDGKFKLSAEQQQKIDAAKERAAAKEATPGQPRKVDQPREGAVAPKGYGAPLN